MSKTAATSPLIETLIEVAKTAQQAAYAPYSRFRVGAALAAGGEVFTGANIENASYGLAVCAERNAIAAAVLRGHRNIEAIAVITDSQPPASPCGMCRQVLAEFCADPAATVVVAFNPAGERRQWTVAELLPAGFSPAQLASGQ